jgi:sporulation protein YlmC with PRC-barrel domain
MTWGANAAETHEVQVERKITQEHTTRSMSAERLGPTEKASSIIGREVKNNQNEKLGKVDNLAIDLESGRVVGVLLSVGGMLGVGDHMVAVPPQALRDDPARKVAYLDTDKERLKAAPKFDTSNWTDAWESNHVTAVYRYYGQEPYFTRQDGVAPIRPADPSNTRSVRNPDGTWTEDRDPNRTDSKFRKSGLGFIQKASKVMGAPVRNQQNEKLGKVEDLVVDMAAGRVVTVIVSSGGFAGIGDELSAVPPMAFHFNSNRDALELNVSKETLTSAPHFKSSQWPDFAEPTYTERTYRAYNVEPYFSASVTTERDPSARNVRERVTATERESNPVRTPDADNTGRNIRDRDDRTLTPLDQGGSPADRNTTAQVRKEIMASKGLSTNARNVKIITINGHVTLRGTVNTEDEKRLLGQIAARTTNPANVDNQLEVKFDNR